MEREEYAADLHLDTPFEGLAASAPHVARALRDASLETWDALVRHLKDKGGAVLRLNRVHARCRARVDARHRAEDIGEDVVVVDGVRGQAAAELGRPAPAPP